MTDNETIKALECCKDNDCDNCPFEEQCRRNGSLADIALDLINRQKTEIDILIRKKETLRDEIAEHQAEIERLKEKHSRMKFNLESVLEERADHTEAIKEFAEKVETDLDKRVSKSIRNRNPHWFIAKRIVRETAIEMTEQSVNYESSKTDEQ